MHLDIATETRRSKEGEVSGPAASKGVVLIVGLLAAVARLPSDRLVLA